MTTTNIKGTYVSSIPTIDKDAKLETDKWMKVSNFCSFSGSGWNNDGKAKITKITRVDLYESREQKLEIFRGISMCSCIQLNNGKNLKVVYDKHSMNIEKIFRSLNLQEVEILGVDLDDRIELCELRHVPSGKVFSRNKFELAEVVITEKSTIDLNGIETHYIAAPDVKRLLKRSKEQGLLNNNIKWGIEYRDFKNNSIEIEYIHYACYNNPQPKFINYIIKVTFDNKDSEMKYNKWKEIFPQAQFDVI